MRTILFGIALLVLGAAGGQLGVAVWNFTRSSNDPCIRVVSVPSLTVTWLTQNPPWDSISDGPPDDVFTGPGPTEARDSDKICEHYFAGWDGPREGIVILTIDRYPSQSVAVAEMEPERYFGYDPQVEDVGTHLEEASLGGDSIASVHSAGCLVAFVRWSQREPGSTPKTRDALIGPVLDQMSEEIC